MKTKRTTAKPPGGTRVPPRVRVRIESGSFKIRVAKPKKKERKILDLRRHPEYADWLTRGEVTAHLQRGLDSLGRLQRQGYFRQVRVFEFDPKRHHVRFHPADVREVSEMLRKRDAERDAKRRLSSRRDAILGELILLPGPDEFLLRNKRKKS